MNLIMKIVRHIKRIISYWVYFDYQELILTLKHVIKFNRYRIPVKSVLIIEPNEFHAEILPGYVNYWNKLDYNVVLVLRRKNIESGVFSKMKDYELPKTYCIAHYGIKYFLNKKKIKDFDYCFLSSSRLSNTNGFYGLFTSYLGFIPQGGLGYFMVEHNFHNLRPLLVEGKYDPDRIFMLNAFQDKVFSIPMLNPNYFGAVSLPRKAEETIFVTIGTLSKRNRDFDELLIAIKSLIDQGLENFKVYVIGRGADAVQLGELPKQIIFLGYLDFTEMYSKLEQAHFFLPLLDPNSIGQQRYLKGETTGSWQLCQGFLKPPIIRREFAESYQFSVRNAILYDKDGLSCAMTIACKMNSDTYVGMTQEIKCLSNQVATKSLEGLKAKLE
ncbi:MAG: hypothetical protein WA775_13615 [Psychroserpens sp.]|uniref:hypothetical protein n=1 Tax=Psychroserpens sp. TaxID=2020870 RepID=UPI003C967609